MPRKKRAPEETTPSLPGKDSPDYFNTLVQSCIAAYEKLNNDSLALDYCKVVDRRLRVLILDDPVYRQETKSIYAQQRLQEIEEIEYLSSLASSSDVEDGDDTNKKDEYVHPSERGKKKKTEKSTAVDRDMLNMRFKAAQMTRELRKDMANAAGDTESHAVNFLFVPILREEFEKLATVEIDQGSGDADFAELLGTKEVMPEGSSGRLRAESTKRTQVEADDFFDVLPDGTVVEKD